jgi:NADPH:quinone reductase-like Zn-dependent oxidoreductase
VPRYSQTLVKAAIVVEAGRTPVYGDFKEPSPASGETRITVAAAALSPLTKARAAGLHYSSSAEVPFIAGVDGVGRLDDGRRVYFALLRPPFGSMSQQAVARLSQCVAIPDDLDDVTAAAIANPGMSSWAALKERAKIAPGETVLVNGATGTAGRLAVQIAKHLGAKKVIATGRDTEVLKSLAALGADVTIPLMPDEEALEDVFTEHLAGGAVDIVLDYLWGPSAERLLRAAAKTAKEAARMRFVQIGSVSASDITLPGAVLRSSGLVLMGSGIGSVAVSGLMNAIKELFEATVPGRFQIAIKALPLSAVEQAWPSAHNTARIVFVPA